MKVFLSHKMTGLAEDEVKQIREDALQYLQNQYGKIELIDNYHHDNAPSDAGRLWHLGASIQLMEEADAVYFCKGWFGANGCAVEHLICRLYNLTILK